MRTFRVMRLAFTGVCTEGGHFHEERREKKRPTHASLLFFLFLSLCSSDAHTLTHVHIHTTGLSLFKFFSILFLFSVFSVCAEKKLRLSFVPLSFLSLSFALLFTHTHSHTHSLTHTHTLAHSHTLTAPLLPTSFSVSFHFSVCTENQLPPSFSPPLLSTLLSTLHAPLFSSLPLFLSAPALSLPPHRPRRLCPFRPPSSSLLLPRSRRTHRARSLIICPRPFCPSRFRTTLRGLGPLIST